MRILFMGTPDFARTCLEGLVKAGEEIVGVVTQPDRPKGRGYNLVPPPVKVYAEEQGFKVYQPHSLKDEAFADLLSELDPELIAVVAYGRILPKSVLDYPRYGCVNVHSSLLPLYRGAAPMQRAIMDGRTETGITTMFMAEGLDTGDILEMLTTPIGENDNFEDIHDRLAEMGAELLPHTVKGLEDGTVTPTPQDERGTCYAEKINKEDCVIDFSKSARVIHNQIRGISPIPLAFTTLNGKMLKVVASRVVKDEGKGEAGRVINLSDGGIHVQCGEGVIALTSVRPEGKGTMPAADFIRGRKVALGDLLGK